MLAEAQPLRGAHMGSIPLGAKILDLLLGKQSNLLGYFKTNERLKAIREEHPNELERAIGELDQNNRLQFIAGKISDDVYRQLQQRTQSFSDQCSMIIETQRREQILETLLLLDEWQETLQTDPDLALQKLTQIRQQYREMLLSNQVDIQAYMELVELTLISVMTLAPKQREQVDLDSVLTSAS